MLRLMLRPRWYAWHLALVAVLVACAWLGWWQLSGFTEERARTATRGVVEVDAATEPGGRLSRTDIGQRVRAVGSWEPAGQVVAPGRDLDGRAGSWVVTPLRTADGVLPIVRGWVATDSAVPAPPAGQVTVLAVLQPSEGESDATAPVGTLPPGQVPYVATVTLLSALPEDSADIYDPARLYDGFAVLRSADPAGNAGLERVRPEHTSAPEAVGRWRNLGYGLQWWVFAAGAIFLWASVLRRAAREQESQRGDDGTTAPGARDARQRTT